MERKPDFPISGMILERWSARAMSGESLADEELMPLLEAARWAPSSRNSQPWRFVYAKRESASWDAFLGLLAESNRVWCKNAAVLIVVLSQMRDDRGELSAHSFDAGAACENLALEGTRRGLVVHPLGGFDKERAKKELFVPDDFSVEVMISVGKGGRSEDLPLSLQEREVPSQRRSLKELVHREVFSKDPPG